MSSYSYFFDKGVCVAAFEGNVTFELLVRALKDYSARAEFDVDMPRILDFRLSTDVMGFDDLVRAAEVAARVHEGGTRRLIAIVCGDTMFEKIVKLYREVLRHRKDESRVLIEFFLVMDDAWAWIAANRPRDSRVSIA